MKLSEAIRLGAMMGPQIRGDYFSSNIRAFFFGSGTCALGAALHAVGRRKSDESSDEGEIWPFINSATLCPCCSQDGEDIGQAIVHLNDFHHWTREQIADWVATIEPAELEQSQAEPVLEASEV